MILVRYRLVPFRLCWTEKRASWKLVLRNLQKWKKEENKKEYLILLTVFYLIQTRIWKTLIVIFDSRVYQNCPDKAGKSQKTKSGQSSGAAGRHSGFFTGVIFRIRICGNETFHFRIWIVTAFETVHADLKMNFLNYFLQNLPIVWFQRIHTAPFCLPRLDNLTIFEHASKLTAVFSDYSRDCSSFQLCSFLCSPLLQAQLRSAHLPPSLES